MKQCEGQISLMDLLAPVIRTAEIPCLLHEGQTVYKVVRECLDATARAVPGKRGRIKI